MKLLSKSVIIVETEGETLLESRQRLILLSNIVAGLNAIAVAVAVYMYTVAPLSLSGYESVAGISVFTLLLYALLKPHLKLGHAHLPGLAGLLLLLSATNLTMLILLTGGLESPFYAFWLMAIVASGLFGILVFSFTMFFTLAAYFLDFLQHAFATKYLISQLDQLSITLVAAALTIGMFLRKQESADIETLQNSEVTQEKLKTNVLLTSMSDGVVVVDAKRKIQIINKSAREMAGWDEASAIGLDWRAVLNLKTAKDEDAAEADDPFTLAWEKKTGVTNNSLAMFTRTGRKIALSVAASPIFNTNGNITGGIAVFRDITAEKELERERSEFISTASHEMRTPVASIEGFLALAMNSKTATIDERAKSYLLKAYESVAHLGELYRDLLSITKLEEGAAVKDLRPVNITKIIEEALQNLQFEAAKKHLSLGFANYTPGKKQILPEFYTLADVGSLREVITNLVQNAIKFSDSGNVSVNINGTQKSVTVSVSDSGQGIAEEDIPHLFQKFYRAGNDEAHSASGTGLGLYLCRKIVESLNGRIWVESTLGKGSVFSFRLPRASAETTPNLQPQTKPLAPNT